MDIVFAGVGGQGVVLASELAALAAKEAGYDVKVSTVHGMAQRGGAVSAFVRYAEQVHSPLVASGTADMLVAQEQLEGLRFAHYLRRGGRLVLDSRRIDPGPVQAGLAEYPEGVAERLRTLPIDLVEVDAHAVARGLGEVRAANVVMLGIGSRKMDIPMEAWEKALKGRLKESIVEVNLAAFREGRKMEL
jgi:indolepyruvate ferredoxin oxidoreductase beta subunit